MELNNAQTEHYKLSIKPINPRSLPKAIVTFQPNTYKSKHLI